MVAKQKQSALDARYEQNPERFVQGPPTVKMPPETVSINPVNVSLENETASTNNVNFPTLAAAGYVKEMLSF